MASESKDIEQALKNILRLETELYEAMHPPLKTWKDRLRTNYPAGKPILLKLIKALDQIPIKEKMKILIEDSDKADRGGMPRQLFWEVSHYINETRDFEVLAILELNPKSDQEKIDAASQEVRDSTFFSSAISNNIAYFLDNGLIVAAQKLMEVAKATPRELLYACLKFGPDDFAPDDVGKDKKEKFYTFLKALPDTKLFEMLKEGDLSESIFDEPVPVTPKTNSPLLVHLSSIRSENEQKEFYDRLQFLDKMRRQGVTPGTGPAPALTHDYKQKKEKATGKEASQSQTPKPPESPKRSNP